ncbi:glutathione S-transferase family protein [Flavisphingomonas formosensis]|uniref:glutathione S-transferase family protein n=1 Tax=Flavisphingomonas formosensis TaxID=861534 RepID=UPI0018E053E2|nr:glutathione S-transferase family protein [Sphingomonas formosensis]
MNAEVAIPIITTYRWVPPFARGLVREVRARWAFEEVGMAYRVDLIDLPYAKSEAHRRFQPFGQIPTYSDGAVEIFESGAIVLHIARQAPGLLPDDAAGQARAIQWVIAALNSIEPFVMDLAVVDVFEADAAWSPARRPTVEQKLRSRLADLSAALGERPYLDDAFSAGDLMMASVLRGVPHSAILADYPNLAAYRARCEARPAFRKALADHLATFDDAGEAPAVA